MKPQRDQYLSGDAMPAGLPRGGNVRTEAKRLTEWLAKRGQPTGWRRRRSQMPK